MNDENHNPWQLTDSRVIYDNPWINVREDAVIRPDGNPGIYGVVHIKNRAVGVLPLDENGMVHLVGQYRYALNIYSWEIPEGGCGADEEPLDAGKRELLEETGYQASEWRLLGRSHLSNSITDEEAFCFLATGLTAGKACPEGTEELRHRTVPFEQVLEMVRTGEITDALSILTISYYALFHR
jgi:8-oxo-dGTP pyrophosphatase MutT (NUDIX family)